MSRLLNAEYACSIRVLVSAIHPPTTLAMHSVLVIRPVHIIADELQQKEGRSGTVFILLLPFDSVRAYRSKLSLHRAASLWIHAVKAIVTEGLNRDRIEPPRPIYNLRLPPRPIHP